MALRQENRIKDKIEKAILEFSPMVTIDNSTTLDDVRSIIRDFMSKHALELIERGNHRLAIYPLSMPPEAPLPADMSDKYNFATL